MERIVEESDKVFSGADAIVEKVNFVKDTVLTESFIKNLHEGARFCQNCTILCKTAQFFPKLCDFVRNCLILCEIARFCAKFYSY